MIKIADGDNTGEGFALDNGFRKVSSYLLGLWRRSWIVAEVQWGMDEVLHFLGKKHRERE